MKHRLSGLIKAPIEEFIAGVALVVVTGSVLWGVLTRYLLAQPAAWSYEVATIGFAWLVFFGAAAGVRYRLHADMDLLVSGFSPKWQRYFAVFNFVLLAVFFAVLAGLFALHTGDAHKSVTVALNVPRSVIYAPLFISAVLMLIRHIEAWCYPDAHSDSNHEAHIT